MKSLQKTFAGLTLGMALCAGLLAASPATAVTVNCRNIDGTICCTFTCPDTIMFNGVTKTLAAVTCTCVTAISCDFGCLYV